MPQLKSTLSYIKPLFSTSSRSKGQGVSTAASQHEYLQGGSSVGLSRVYRKMSESEHAITLTELPRESGSDISLPQEHRNIRQSGTGILRTTEVRAAISSTEAPEPRGWQDNDGWAAQVTAQKA
jgi:hypothetical protein